MSELIAKNFGNTSVPLGGETGTSDAIVTLLDTDLNPIYPYTTFDAVGELDTKSQYTKGVLKSAAKRESYDFLLSSEPIKEAVKNPELALSHRADVTFITGVTPASVNSGGSVSDKKIKCTYITYASLYADLQKSLKPDLVTDSIKYYDESDTDSRKSKYWGKAQGNEQWSLTSIIKDLDTRVEAKAKQGEPGKPGPTPEFRWSIPDEVSDGIKSKLTISLEGREVSSADLRGPAGAQGKPGPKGDPGTSVTINGEVNSVEDLAGSGISKTPGSGYIILSGPSMGHLYVYTGEHPDKDSGFIDVGEIKGPKGDAGVPPKFQWDRDKNELTIIPQEWDNKNKRWIDGSKTVIPNLKGSPGKDGSDAEVPTITVYKQGNSESSDLTPVKNQIKIKSSNNSIILEPSGNTLDLKVDPEVSHPIQMWARSSESRTVTSGYLELTIWDDIIKPIKVGHGQEAYEHTNVYIPDGCIKAEHGFFETSDARLKDITSDISLEKSTEFIKSSHAVNYTLKSDPTKTHTIGLIAQEVEEYFPEVVESHSDGYKSINYAKLGVILFPVVKDLLARVEALEVQLSNKK